MNLPQQPPRVPPWIFALLCWRIWSSLCPHLCLRSILLVLQSLEAEFLGEEKQQNRIKVSWGAELEEKIYLYLFSRLIKMWCPSSFPNHFSMCDWISVYDHMMMLVRSLFHVYLIIIALYVVIMVWGRYNSFCKSLGARGSRRGLKGCLDQPSFG